MAFVSCKYAPPPPFEGDPQIIICTDDQGVEWTLTEDCVAGDWLEFQEEGGEVLAYEAPEAEIEEEETQ